MACLDNPFQLLGLTPSPTARPSASRGAAHQGREQAVLSAVPFRSAFLFVFSEWRCWIVTSRRGRGGSRCFAASLMWVFSSSSNSLPSQRSELHPLLITAALQRRARATEKIPFSLAVSKQCKEDEDSCVCSELI